MTRTVTALVALVAVSIMATPLAAQPVDAPLLATATLDTPPPPFATQGVNIYLHSSPIGVPDLFGAGRPGVVVASNNGVVAVYEWVGPNLSMAQGWPRSLGAHVASSPTVGDWNGDGEAEVVIGIGTVDDSGDASRLAESGVISLRLDGTTLWHRRLESRFGFTQVFSSAAAGDVNADGVTDLVFTSYNGGIYAVDARSGADLPGFPFWSIDTIWSSPALVSLDPGGPMTIVVGADFGWLGEPAFGCTSPPTQGLLFAIRGDGVLVPGYPKCLATPIWSSPAIALVAGAPVAFFGTNNLPFCDAGQCNYGGGQSAAYAYDLLTGAPLPGWPVVLPHGPSESGLGSPAPCADGTTVAFSTTWGDSRTRGSLYLINIEGAVLWEQTFEQALLGSPVSADVTGDGQCDVLMGGGDGRLRGFDRSGSARYQFASTGPFFNSAHVADLDGDGGNEVVVATGEGFDRPRLWVIDSAGVPSSSSWGAFRANQARIGTFLTPCSVRSVAAPPAPAPAPPPDLPPPTQPPDGGPVGVGVPADPVAPTPGAPPPAPPGSVADTPAPTGAPPGASLPSSSAASTGRTSAQPAAEGRDVALTPTARRSAFPLALLVTALAGVGVGTMIWRRARTRRFAQPLRVGESDKKSRREDDDDDDEVEPDLVVEAIKDGVIELACRDQETSEHLKALGARKRRKSWALEVTAEQLPQCLASLRALGFSFMAGRGRSPAAQFEHHRDEGRVEGEYVELRKSEQGVWVRHQR